MRCRHYFCVAVVLLLCCCVDGCVLLRVRVLGCDHGCLVPHVCGCFPQAAMWMAIGSVLSFCGIVHTYSLVQDGFAVDVELPRHGNLQLQFGSVYAAVAALLMALHFRDSDGLFLETLAQIKRRVANRCCSR